MWATSSSYPCGMVAIHSRREATAVSVGEGVGDCGWTGALGAYGGAAAQGCLGTGAGIAKEMLGASVGASGLDTACLSTLARPSRLGAWCEVRTAAARITGTRARNCGEPGGGSLNEAGTALRTGLATAGSVDKRPRTLVAMDRRGGRDRMKPPSLTAPAYRCAEAARWTCRRASTRSSQTRSRSRLRDARSSWAACSSCCRASYRSLS